MPSVLRTSLPGLLLALTVAVVAWVLAATPVLAAAGPLSLALLLGLAVRTVWTPPAACRVGLALAARTGLRLGVALVGLRLEFALLLHAGATALWTDLAVVATGLWLIPKLGRRLGLTDTLATLIAVGSSICGASAVAAAGPVLRARDDDIALAMPLSSLLGTTLLLLLGLAHAWVQPTATHYGLFIGATLHEVAQVMAAGATVPAAADLGALTKLTRVLLLAPVLAYLGWRLGNTPEVPAVARPSLRPPGFVVAFLALGAVNSLVGLLFPGQHRWIAEVRATGLSLSTGLIATAMAAMGVSMELHRLRTMGLRALATAILGWLAIAAAAATSIAVLAS